MKDNINNQKIEISKKINLGVFTTGGIAYGMTNTIIMSYLAFFCTDIFGVSSMIVAGMMLGTKMIDAITDPIMGMIADRTRTKHGRYRPYVIIGAPIMGFLVYLLFSSPNLTDAMKVVFLYVVYILYVLTFTLVGVPFTALVPVVAKNTSERAFVACCKNIMTQLGTTFVTSFALPLVAVMGGGEVGWARYGALIGTLIAICFWTAAWGAKKHDTIEAGMMESKPSMKKELQMITKNKPLQMLIVAFGSDMVAYSAYMAANMYYFKYVLGREDLVPITSLALTLTGLLINFFLPFVLKKIDKKKMYWWGTLLAIIPLAILLIKPIVPAAVLLGIIIVSGIISALPSNIAWIMLPDCVDYAEYKTGEKGNAIVSSAFTFFNKLGLAFGSAATSFFLGLVGYVANQDQPENVIKMIVFLRFGMPILGYIVSLISMHFYGLTEEKNLEVQKVLRERRNKE